MENNTNDVLTLEKPVRLLKPDRMKNTNEPLTLEEIRQVGKIPINFLVGKERSGTTLLQIILNSNPNIVAPPESRFIMLLYSRYRKITKWTEKTITSFWNDLCNEKAYKTFWDNDKKLLLASLLNAREIATYPLLCKLVFYHFSSGKDIKLFFDKNPIYSHLLPKLKVLFPDAKYIHLIRDYRANIASHRRVFMFKQSDDVSYKWLKMHQEVEVAKNLSPESYFTIKYENLVSFPEESIKELCSFLQVPFDEKMISGHSHHIYSSYNKNTKPRFRNIHQHLFNPITPTFVDEWKKVLTPEDISKAEKIAGAYGEKMYRYPRLASGKPARRNIFSRFATRTKYETIKNIYLLALNNPRLYFFITKHIWKGF